MTSFLAIGIGLCIFLSASTNLWAAEVALSPTELKQTANQEIQNAGAASPTDPTVQKASDAAVSPDGTSSGMLHLQDDFHSLKARTFLMTFGMQVQSYRPSGQGDFSNNGSSYNLADAGSTIMPSLSLGTLYNLGGNRLGDWQAGLEAEAGYTSQKIQDARLSTTLLEMRPLLRWAPHDSKFHLFTGYGLGRANITQSSSNSMEQWNKSGNMTDWLLGADYAMSEKWLVQLTSKTISVSKADAGFDLPSNQVELGAKVLW